MNKKNKINKLIDIVKALRDPNDGCDWDKEQTSLSLLPYLIEETYETIDAIITNNQDDIKEELGDLLLQIVLHSVIAEENLKFTLNDIIDEISNKLIRRHPHIFKQKKKLTKEELVIQWNKIKREEKKYKKNDNFTILDEKTEKSALLQALHVSIKASKLNFDWNTYKGPLNKINEELKEVEDELNKKNINKEPLMNEIGDLLFSIVNLCRHLEISPEISLLMSNDKFKKRLNQTIRQFKDIDDFKESSSHLKNKAWKKAKKS